MSPIATPARPATTAGWGHGTVAESLRLAASPSTGRFRAAVAPGDEVQAGDVLAFVTGSRDRADAVRSPADGVVRALLVRPGQLVATGRALVWVQA